MERVTKNSRDARQYLADILKETALGRRVAVERLGSVAGAVVSPAALDFIEALEAAHSVDALLDALAGTDVGGHHFVRPELLAALRIAVHDRGDGARGLLELPRAVVTRRDGRVVLIEFGGDPKVLDGYVNITGNSDGALFLNGSLELANGDLPVGLELSNGQVVSGFERDGNGLFLRKFPLTDDVQLEFTKIRE